MVAPVILLETVFRRWYAFAFVVLFFWAASAERGWRRAARFLAVAAFISFLAEYASTHSPFPYGRYEYIAETSGDEAFPANVPIFVPIAFGTVVWAGRALARVFGAEGPGLTIAGGAIGATVLDLVIDPITLRGHEWFLGRLYAFRAQDGWFDVPWSNYAGWLLVAGLILWTDELLEVHQARVIEPIRGPTLAFAILGFFLLIALFTGSFAIFFVSALLTGVVFWLARPRIAALLRESERGPASG